MSAGASVTGREVKAAFARCNTWGTPASVTRQCLISGTDGWDSQPQVVTDESINQDFLQAGEVGDFTPPTPTLQFVSRFEDIDTLFAACHGSAAAPTVVSSVAANSLVAYQHIVTLATELQQFFTFAADVSNYIVEIPSLKLTGYTFKVGENGRMMVEFSTTGARSNYDSTVNTNSTVSGAATASLGNRMFRKNGTWRMNLQTAGALGASDAIGIVKEITLGTTRPVAGEDFVFGQDYIIEPDDDGFPEFPVQVTYARMNTISASSLANALQTAKSFKADWSFLGPYINSTTQRQMKWEMPALQLTSFKAVVTGPNQVRPEATFMARSAASSVAGMAFIQAMKLTIVNANSANLLA